MRLPNIDDDGTKPDRPNNPFLELLSLASIEKMISPAAAIDHKPSSLDKKQWTGQKFSIIMIGTAPVR